ncbi:hypothetical protein FACS189496_4680 [Bacilli bacterium]|nr:hypothetical protein FACS189496_4680 [Bacilli bacterium]
MSLYKDLTFVHPKNSIMQPTIDKLNNLSFFEKVEFIGKFNREECQTYTLRVYFKNNNNISNEDINT